MYTWEQLISPKPESITEEQIIPGACCGLLCDYGDSKAGMLVQVALMPDISSSGVITANALIITSDSSDYLRLYYWRLSEI